MNKAFILRIPYPLENENTLSYRIRSEVATMDFADLKLGIKVPKIFCYGVNSLNPVRQPFVLQEFIEGELLMKDWDPLIEDGSSNQKKYDNVIKQVSRSEPYPLTPWNTWTFEYAMNLIVLYNTYIEKELIYIASTVVTDKLIGI